MLFKGRDTVISDPDGSVELVGSTGAKSAPWLATADAGDVLAGLLARGLVPRMVSALGARLHAAAAHRFGPGLLAEDLP